jgi:hypothetical protein
MTRPLCIAIAALSTIALMTPDLSLAQSTSAQTSPPTLVEVAKAEQARRQGVRKPARVFTNGDLKGDLSGGTSAPATRATSPAPPAATTPAIDIPAGTAPEATTNTRDQAYWSQRMTTARTAVDRSRLFAESLQTRINSLTTDFVNRDDPAQRAKIDADRRTALAELERLKQEMAVQEKEIAAIQDEARRAGVPAGWLRPGA